MERGAWLLIAMTSGADDSLRVRVWRELRRLGAVYLQNSVCLLPDQPDVTAAVTALARRVRAGGGRARVLHIQLLDPGEEAEVIADQTADRDREYGDLVERSAEFEAEIDRELARNNATYTEVEESETDLARFERWFASITARDYFHTPRRADAEAALARCQQRLAEFEALAVTADTRADNPTTLPRPAGLRAVGDQP